MSGECLGPGYWMYETSGVLAPVVRGYLEGKVLGHNEIRIMRAYLRQWMNGDWKGEEAIELRRRIDGINCNATLTNWLNDAVAAGIDPL